MSNIFKNILSLSDFEKMKSNEDVTSSSPETRLNIFKNFNNIGHDQVGGMEIFAPRINSEINRMNDEIFNIDVEEDDESTSRGTDENGVESDDLYNDFDDNDTGLVINKKDQISTPRRTLNYPYGMDNNPPPSFSLDNETQSKSGIIFRFADYRGINNFR